MILNSKKALMFAAFALIAASSFSLQMVAMDFHNEQRQQRQVVKEWTDEEFYSWTVEYTILHNAVRLENIDLVIQILDDPRAPNIINTQSPYSKDTALHLAAQASNKTIYQLLIDKGADETITNYRKRTAESYFEDPFEIHLGHYSPNDQEEDSILSNRVLDNNEDEDLTPPNRISATPLWKKVLAGGTAVVAVGIIGYFIKNYFDKNKQEEKEA